jgi:hypothetical protein
MEEAIAQWREQSDVRAKCNEQWCKYSIRFEEFIEAIKSEVSDDIILCMEYVETLPNDCGEILAIDSYMKHLPARILLAEILEKFATNRDYMTDVKMFVDKRVRKQW